MLTLAGLLMRQCPSRRAAMRRKSPSFPTQIALFPPPEPPQVELCGAEQQELIRALAKLLGAAADAGLTTTAKEAEREGR